MATLNVKSSKNAGSSLLYVTRNGRHKAISGNMLHTEDRAYMVAEANRHLVLHDVGQNEHSRAQTQAYSFVMSFGHDEFPKDSDPEEVNRAGYDYFKTVYDDVPFCVVTHNDGAGQKWHNHVVVLNADVNGKALRAERSRLFSQREGMNNFFLENKDVYPTVDVLTKERLKEKSSDKKHQSLAVRVESALKRSASIKEFEDNLETFNIKLMVRTSRSKKADKQGKVTGIKFKDERSEVTARSSRLDESLHYKKILERLAENKENRKQGRNKSSEFEELFAEEPKKRTPKFKSDKTNEVNVPTTERSEGSGSFSEEYDYETVVHIPDLVEPPKAKPKSKPKTKPKEKPKTVTQTKPVEPVARSGDFLSEFDRKMLAGVLKSNAEFSSKAVRKSPEKRSKGRSGAELPPL